MHQYRKLTVNIAIIMIMSPAVEVFLDDAYHDEKARTGSRASGAKIEAPKTAN